MEAKQRLQMYGRLSRSLSEASSEGSPSLVPLAPEDAAHLGLPLPVIDADVRTQRTSRGNPPNTSHSLSHGGDRGAEQAHAADLFPTTGVLSFFHAALNDTLGALCEAHHLTSPREIAAMRQVSHRSLAQGTRGASRALSSQIG